MTRPRRWIPAAAVLALAIAIAAVARGRADDDAAPDRASVAVLPFVDLSPAHDREFFSDGMTEELINTLGRVEGVRVASRTSSFSFKGQTLDVREVGTRLGVATVLDGSVRTADSTLRITARLSDARNGYQLWSRTYERKLEDVFAIQEEISRSIVETLKGTLIGSADSAATARRHEAHNLFSRRHTLYMKGRYSWYRRTEEGLKSAAAYFAQAIEKDSTYALAHAGLADAHAVLGFYDYLAPRDAFPRAELAAKRAMALDSTLVQPYATLGYVELYHDWDWARAEEWFTRAIDVGPRYSTAHQWYANFLTARGRFEDAERAMRRAQEIDPLSLIASAAHGWVLYHAGEFERAAEQCRLTLELDPDYAVALLWRGWALQELGRGRRGSRAARARGDTHEPERALRGVARSCPRAHWRYGGRGGAPSRAGGPRLTSVRALRTRSQKFTLRLERRRRRSICSSGPTMSAPTPWCSSASTRS